MGEGDGGVRGAGATSTSPKFDLCIFQSAKNKDTGQIIFI